MPAPAPAPECRKEGRGGQAGMGSWRCNLPPGHRGPHRRKKVNPMDAVARRVMEERDAALCEVAALQKKAEKAIAHLIRQRDEARDRAEAAEAERVRLRKLMGADRECNNCSGGIHGLCRGQPDWCNCGCQRPRAALAPKEGA